MEQIDLTPQQEERLARLLASAEGKIRSQARKFAKGCNDRFEDNVQIGMIALWRSVARNSDLTDGQIVALALVAARNQIIDGFRHSIREKDFLEAKVAAPLFEPLDVVSFGEWSADKTASLQATIFRNELRAMLKDFDAKVFDAIFSPDDEMLEIYRKTAEDRANGVGANGAGLTEGSPYGLPFVTLLSRRFGCSLRTVSRSFERIREVYRRETMCAA